jgi:ATP-dependent DNA helicase RecG
VPRHGDRTDPARLQALIANQTVPPVPAVVELVPDGDSEVIAIKVPKSSTVVGTSGGTYVRRAIRLDGAPQCVPFPAHEMLAREIDRGVMDYAALRAEGLAWDDLDPSEFERFRNLVATAGAAGDAQLRGLGDVEIARALGVVDLSGPEPRPLVGALLLFGRGDSLRRFVPTHEAAFQVLRGGAVETNEFLHAPLLQCADELFTRFSARNTEEELQLGMIRVAIPLVPTVAVGEAIANALVHRDYTRMRPVAVQLSDEALTVSSPGGFPDGVRLDNLLEVSHPRSRILADAFKRSGLVERTGRGVNRMFEAALRFGRDAPDFSRSTDTGVTASFDTSAPDLGWVRFVLEREASSGVPMRLEDLQILHELRRESRLSTAETAALLQKPEPLARASLRRLVGQGLVEERGTGRGRRYHLAASVFRAIDERAGYVRVRGFDALQQQQMVLTFVTSHGSITRSQAAELGRLTPSEASQLLRRLAASGLLRLVGERRGAHYVLPGEGMWSS